MGLILCCNIFQHDLQRTFSLKTFKGQNQGFCQPIIDFKSFSIFVFIEISERFGKRCNRSYLKQQHTNDFALKFLNWEVGTGKQGGNRCIMILCNGCYHCLNGLQGSLFFISCKHQSFSFAQNSCSASSVSCFASDARSSLL